MQVVQGYEQGRAAGKKVEYLKEDAGKFKKQTKKQANKIRINKEHIEDLEFEKQQLNK